VAPYRELSIILEESFDLADYLTNLNQIPNKNPFVGQGVASTLGLIEGGLLHLRPIVDV